MRFMIALGMAGFLLLPPLFWIVPGWLDNASVLNGTAPAELLPWQRAAGAAVALGVGALGAWMLSGLWVLFGLYARGVIFQAENVAALRRFAHGLLVWVLAGMAATPVSTVIATAANAPGARQVAVGIEDGQITSLVLAGVFLVIARVMDEGRALHDDNAQIV
jgi:hypothetical protein